jgi:phosphorylase kinase alpha/beta subunit
MSITIDWAAPPWGTNPLWTSYLGFDPSLAGPLSVLEEFDVERETDLDRLLQQLRSSSNVYEQIELLSTLKSFARRLDFNTGLGGPVRIVTVRTSAGRNLCQSQPARAVGYSSSSRRAAGKGRHYPVGCGDRIAGASEANFGG